MKLTPFLLFAAAALALAGCSTPTKVSSGDIHAATFNFVNPGPRNMPGYVDQAAPVHAAIQQAITRNFAGRGVRKVDSGGDLTIGYLLIVGNNASTASINDYFGYRDDLEGLQDKAYKAYTENKNPNYFEAGTLLIDVLDSRSNKLLKRAHATRPILQNPSTEQRAGRIQEVVDEILKGM